MYSIQVTASRVYIWAKKGLPRRTDRSRHYFLRITILGGRYCVRKADLMAFLEAT